MASALAAAASACGGASDPPAASPGFFPATYTGATVVNAQLAKSGEVGPDKSALTFHISVPKGQAYAVVIRCDKGRIEVSVPGGIEGGPCVGPSLGFLDNGCDGGKRTLKFRVSEAQPRNWGVALYTGRDAASATCR